LGAATLSLRHRIPEDNTIIAVDNSAPMIARCQTVIERDTAKPQVELRCEDIQDVEIAQLDTSTTQVSNPATRKINMDIVFNELECGYSKYSKENEDGS
ncbi:MAG TPA: hypothetical protein DCZ12_15435, partial [Gammaproteobacteria bacterium]|nr:hypothetical protein [Gammaproteobacteria bacterium]